MKFRFVYTCFLLGLVAVLSLANKSGRAANGKKGSTGAPGDNDVVSGVQRTCLNCHAGSATIQISLSVELIDTVTNAAVTKYTPLKTYKTRITVNKIAGNPSGYGAQMVVLKDAGNVEHKGFSSPSANAQLSTIAGSRTYLEQKTISTSNIFEAKWTAPSAGSGSVTFYAAGNGVNGNNASGGDAGAKTTLQISEATSATSDFEAVEKTMLFVSPNPIGDDFSLIINELAQSSEVEIEIWSSTGQPFFSQKIRLENGFQKLSMHSADWPSGVFFVKMSQAGRVVAVTKLVKVGS